MELELSKVSFVCYRIIIMNIIIAIIMMSSVESNLNLDSKEEYIKTKKVIQVVKLLHGIK